MFDPVTRTLDAVADVYFVGEQLYVAPVLTASTSARRVIFPRGVFYDFFRPGGRYSGEPRVEAPRTEIPVFAPAGAIVPMLPRAFETANPHPTRVDLDDLRWSREVHVFLGAAGRVREFAGGAYVLASPGAVSAVRGIEPAPTFTGTSSATVSLGMARKLTFKDSEGRLHVLELEGVDARLAVDVIVRW